MVSYEAMTPQCGRSVVQVLVVIVDIRVMIDEGMTPQRGRSVFQIVAVRVDTGQPSVGGQWFGSRLSEWI